ncbi:unnamed protein product [Arabidopsis lyrata]|nr:unnamed protein product [Arabidopsis lyrata]
MPPEATPSREDEIVSPVNIESVVVLEEDEISASSSVGEVSQEVKETELLEKTNVNSGDVVTETKTVSSVEGSMSVMMSLGSTNIKPIVEKECCHVLADTNIEPIVEKECCHVLGDTNIEPIMEKECCHELGDTNFDLITRKRVPIGLGNENSKPIGGRVPLAKALGLKSFYQKLERNRERELSEISGEVTATLEANGRGGRWSSGRSIIPEVLDQSCYSAKTSQSSDPLNHSPNRITSFPGKRLASRISGLGGMMLSRHTRILGGRLWGFPSNAGPINMYGNSGDSSDNSVIPSEHVRLMLKGLESESFMATSPSVTSVESISTREMVDLGGNLGSVSVSDFVVLSDDSVEDFSDEFEESEEQMATGYLYGDVDAPMWEGPDGVKYELTSDDSGQPAVYANSHPPLPDKWSTLESFGSLSLEPDFAFSDVSSEETDSRSSDYIVFLPTEYGIPRQALAYNMVPPSKVFATPPGPPSPDFVELSLDNELADAEESVMELLIPNFVKAESLRMSTPPRRERVFRSADGTFVPTMECEDGLMSEPLRMTPFCFTCGQDGHYPRTCPYVHRYHPYARPYVVCFECGDDGHYASVCPRKYPKNPGSSSPSPSASARKLKGNLSTY